MTRGTFGVEAALKLSEDKAYELGLLLSVGDGPTELRIGPGKNQPGQLALKDMVKGLAEMLGIDRFEEVGGLPTSWPWSKILAIEVQPQLTVEVTGEPSVALVLELFENKKPGVRLPGDGVPSWLTIKPDFTVYDLVIGYDKKRGLDVRARVEFEDQQTTLQAGSPPPTAKKELVSFPFPTPPPANQNLQVKYLGLGQRFGPKADLRSEDPLEKLFTELEDKLSSNNPTELLESLASYYDPKRDWFFGAHVLLRGWEVRAVLSDPALYGLEIACSVKPFKGLKVEILYQKLGSGVGVFYGALEMPEEFRSFQLGVVSLTLPSFKLWIYTNGDFKVSVGWPLGPNSIGVQVYIFTGGGGFYFAKLRSADNPASGGQALLAQGSEALAETPNYNPILEFGLGVWFGVGRSFSAGPFSAELSLTMRGTFQGLLAWTAPPSDGGPEKASSIAKAPDYYWFAASVGIVGVLQGKVDLKIVSLSILVRLEASAAIALETGCATQLTVRASVDAEASLRIVFITITVGFHATIEQSFTLSGGSPDASINGPQNPLFHGMNDWAVADLETLEATLLENKARLAALPPPPPAPVAPRTERERTEVEVGFLLQPAAVYEGEKGTPCGFAGFVVSTKATAQKEGPAKSQFEKLTDALAEWLLDEFGGGERKWSAVAAALEASKQSQWEEQLEAFVAAELKFEIHGIDLEKEAAGKGGEVAFLPMLEDLQMGWTGREKPVVFAEQARTRANYEEVVERYFAELSLAGLGPEPPSLDDAVGDGEEPPTGPSLTRFIFGDYFLMISRQLAKELAEGEGQRGAGALPTPEEARGAAEIGSRYLLNGLRLPDPATTPEHITPDEFSKLTIASGYALNGQQFEADATKPKCEATLRVRSEPGPVGKASIAFAGGGESATSAMSVEKAPPAPLPVWVGPGKSGARAAAATIELAAIPPGTPKDTWIGVRNRLPWQGTAETPLPAIVPLPPEVATAAGEGDLRLHVQKEPPPAEEESLKVRPALLIPIRAHRVDRLRLQDLKNPSESRLLGDQKPEAESPYVPFVYRLDGTDEGTRAQISAALAANALGAGAQLSVLYNDEKAGYRSDQVDPAQVLLAKANLSTTSQPASLTTPLRFATLDEEPDPTTANLNQVPQFARLLWELSVVQAGGFYLRYQTREKQGLPDQIFNSPGELPENEAPTGDSAELMLAITFPEATPVSNWHNAFVVALGEYKNALYVGLTDTAKKPLQTLHPSYPPGCVGFDGTWQDAHLLAADVGGTLYSEDWVGQLYHQLQFKVSGGEPKSSFDPSLWSLALSPVKNEAGEKGPSDRYRQVLPAYRFAHGAGEDPNPYAAVGGTVQLTFRIGDVFGNVLDGATHDGSLPVLYNDPLLNPGEWPGVRIAHRFLPSADKSKGPRLRLSFAFDPEAVVKVGSGQEDPHAAEEQAKAALNRYVTAIAQLQDSRTEAVVATSLPGLLGNLGAVNAELAGYAEEIVEQLEKVAKREEPKPVPRAFEWAIDPTRLAEAESDIVPVEVTLEMSRPEDLVYVGSDGKPVEKGVRSTFPVPADLSPREEQGSGRMAKEEPTPPEVALLPYAEDFEETFEKWDGKNGTARLAARHDREDLATNAATPPLWVLRMAAENPRAGIDVAFEEGKAAYFSLAPLAVELVNEKAMVPEFAEDLKEKGEREEAFTGIDLDQWGEAFLAAMDEVLSPAIGTALALANGKAYEELMGAKADLAAALAKGVEPVFDGTNEEVVEGDAKSARDAFEQSLLAKLASAFTVSTIVQVPAAVSAHDAKGPLSPRLFGALSAVEDENQASAEESVALSSPKLPLKDGQSQPFLTFMASATDPGKAANLDLSLSWNARFVEHLLDHEPEKYGYEPSEWLRFVREYKADPLDFSLGKFQVPVPSRRFPSTPVLEGQSATQVTSKGDELAEFLAWKYENGVVLSELEAQDILRLAVTYNRPLQSPPPKLNALGDEEPTLFEALAGFTVAWQVLRPHLQGLPDDSSSEAAKRAITTFVKQAQRVAGAWARHYDSLRAEAFTAPSERIDHYALDFAKKAKNEIQVYAQVPQAPSGEGDEKAIVWPLVNGEEAGPPELAKDPPDSGRWYVATYTFKAPPSGDAAKLELEWAPLDVLALQTGCSAGWLTRNADLSGGSNLPTNSAFVYKTPEVAFNNPVVPLIVAPEVSSPSTGTLAETLEKALAPLARAGTGVSKQRLLKLWCDYEFTLVGDGSGEAIRSRNPILLADEIELLSDEKKGANGSTLADVCKELEENCGTWFEYFRPSRKEAQLLFAVVLLADLEGAKLPLVRVEALKLDVLPTWWPSP